MQTVIEYQASTFQIKLQVAGDTADMYPKSYGAFNTKCWDRKINGYCFVGVCIQATLASNDVNKGSNESGLDRLKKFVKHAKKLHGAVEFKRTVSFSNDIELPETIRG